MSGIILQAALLWWHSRGAGKIYAAGLPLLPGRFLLRSTVMGTLLASELPVGVGPQRLEGAKVELSFSLDDPAFQGDHFR